jgi:hypothetical protein
MKAGHSAQPATPIGLEAVGQTDGKFDSSFRIVLDVDMDHQR